MAIGIIYAHKVSSNLNRGQNSARFDREWIQRICLSDLMESKLLPKGCHSMEFRAKDMMSRCELVKISPRATLGDLDALLAENLISGTPVVNKNGKLVGVVSQTDIITFIYKVLNDSYSLDLCPGRAGRKEKQTLDQEIRSTEIWEIMQHKVHTVTPETEVSTVAQMMRTHHIHRVFVVDENDELVGVVTANDLLYLLEDSEWLKGVLDATENTFSQDLKFNGE